VAVTLVDWDELHRWKTISDDLGLEMPEAPETYSTSPHLYADLEIPETATGRLPLSRRTRAGLDAEYVDTEGDNGGRRRRSDRPRGRRTAEAELPDRPRRSRTRTRSRGGVSLNADGTPAEAPLTGVTGSAAETTPAEATQPVDVDGSAQDSGSDAGAPRDSKPRRRRRRGGAGRRTTDVAEPSAPDAAAS
jgi:hypothetical protein